MTDITQTASILPPDGTLIYVSEWRRTVSWIVFGWFGLGSLSIAVMAPFLGGIAGFGIALGASANAALCVRALMTGICLEPDGVKLRTALRTYRWRWDEIDHFELKPRGYIPWFYIHLRDGQVKKARGFVARRPEEETRGQLLL